MKAKLLTLTVTALITGSVFAATVSKWEGTGTVYDLSGKQLATYTISTTDTEIAANVIQNERVITMPDGGQQIVSQKITISGNSWSVESNFGNGGGACYGNDFCENYISDENGLAYATTIMNIGPNTRKNVTVELQNGKAIKFFHDKLNRIQ